MFRIDDPTASPTLPAPSAAGVPGFFTGGDPATGEQPTTVTQDWANTVQEELMAILAHAGIVPDKTNRAQVLAALLTMTGSAGSNANGNWEKRGSGIMEQWGSIAQSSTTEPVVAITFPQPFADTSYVVSPVGFINAASSFKDTWAQIIEGTKTVNGFSVQYQNPADVGTPTYGMDGVEWRAIGKWS